MKKNFIWIVLSLFLLGYVTIEKCPPVRRMILGFMPSEKARALVEQGWKLEEQGKLKEALDSYDQAIKLDSKCALAFQHRGQAFRRIGAFEQSIVQFKRAMDLDPKSATIQYELGNLYLDMGDAKNAIDSFSKAISLENDYLEAILNRAVTYLRQRDFIKSLEDFNHYLRIKNDDIKVFLIRSSVYQMMGDLKSAVDSYNRVIALDPRNLEALQARSFVYQRLGQSENAQKDLERIKTIDIKSYKSLSLLWASYYVAQKELDKAYAKINEVITMDPDNVRAYLVRIKILEEMQKYDEALVDLDKAFEKTGQNVPYYLFRAEIYAKQKKFDEAWQDVEKVRKMKGRISDRFIFNLENQSNRMDPQRQLGSSGDYITYAQKYFIKGYFKKSYDLLDRGLRNYPNDKGLEQFKGILDQMIQTTYKGEIPEKVEVQGGELVTTILNIVRDSNPSKIEAKLGEKNDKDQIILPNGMVTLKGPQSWVKKANFRLPQGNLVLLQYDKFTNTNFPSIVVSTDQVDSSVHSALEFSQTVRDKFLKANPSMDISVPKEELINGQKVSYMEFGARGTHDIAFRLGWFQVLFNKTILTFQYTGSAYQLREGMAEFRKIIESLEFTR